MEREKISKVYVNMKKKACNKLGIRNIDFKLDEDVSETELIKTVESMNNNDSIHGILFNYRYLNTLIHRMYYQKFQFRKMLMDFMLKAWEI